MQQNIYDEEVISKILPKKLKDFRVRQGLTMEEVGGMLNKTRSAISTWESGKAIPDATSLLKLIKLYKLGDFNDFFDVNAPLNYDSLTKNERKIISLYRNLPKNTQKSIENILIQLNKKEDL